MIREAVNLLFVAGAQRLDDLAELVLLGRYKRYYVNPDHGTPILSGRQLLQYRPVNLQYISDRSFSDPESFKLQQGWTIFTCDGRVEEGLGAAAYVHSAWKGWMASNHVMRAIPKPHIRAGYLYLALRSPYVLAQLKSRATGSVVDALDLDSISDVFVPVLRRSIRDRMGEQAEEAWEKIAESLRIQDQTVAEVESLITTAYELGR